MCVKEGGGELINSFLLSGGPRSQIKVKVVMDSEYRGFSNLRFKGVSKHIRSLLGTNSEHEVLIKVYCYISQLIKTIHKGLLFIDLYAYF